MNLRKIDSDLEGHPTPRYTPFQKVSCKHCTYISSFIRLNFIDVATGSLGQGLSVACGMAYAAKHFDKVLIKLSGFFVFILLGDRPLTEPTA